MFKNYIFAIAILAILITSAISFNLPSAEAFLATFQPSGVGSFIQWKVSINGATITNPDVLQRLDAVVVSSLDSVTNNDWLFSTKNNDFSDYRFVTDLGSTQITSLKVEVDAKKIVKSGATKIRIAVKCDGIIYEGTGDFALTTSFATYRTPPMLTNPILGGVWNAADFDSGRCTAGPKHQTDAKESRVNGVRLVFDAVDLSPPLITPVITGIAGSNDWYRSDVTVSWNISDPESGIASSTCNSGDVISDTTGVSFTCTATNGAGLTTGPISVTIKRDTVLPEVDIAEGDFEVQASTTSGEPVTFTTTGSDALSGLASDPTCTRDGPVISGDVQPIAQNAIVCSVTDNAGNTNSDTLNVNVKPYLDLGNVQINNPSTVTVSDPAASGSISVTVNSGSTLTVPPALTLSLTETGSGTGVFTGSFLSSGAPTTSPADPPPANLLAVESDPVAVTYTITRGGVPLTSSDGTFATAPGLSSLIAASTLQWNSAAVHIGSSEGITANRVGTGCSANGVTNSFDVIITSPADTTGITIPLTETTPDSCIFTNTLNVFFVAAPSVSSASTPAILTAGGQTVTVREVGTTTPLPTIYVLAAPLAVPVLGTVVSVTSSNCSSYGGDTDNDGICNQWEPATTSAATTSPLTISAFGVTYRYTQSGSATLCPRLLDDRNPITGYPTDTTNPVTCPRQNVKDIFYEIDYMPMQRPSYDALMQVINAFNNAPSTGSTACPSPLTCPGPIKLHIKLDQQLPVRDRFLPWTAPQTTSLTCDLNLPDLAPSRFCNPMGGFDEVKRVFFMSPFEQFPAVTQAIEDANQKSQRQFMRYMVFSVQQDALVERTSSGSSEVLGNDAEISLGAFSLGVGTDMEKAGTMMHEIGHNINLEHGGSSTDKINCKPNHLSVMNYAFQFSSIHIQNIPYVTNRPLDFSRVQLPNLDELHLNEANGIAATGVPITGGSYNTLRGPPPPSITNLNTGAATSINWNGGTSNEPDVSANINNLGFLGCNESTIGTLGGSHDWSKINLKFRDNSLLFADGIVALNPINPSQQFGDYETSVTTVGSGIDPPTPVITFTKDGTTSPVINNAVTVNEGDTFTLDSSGSTDVPPGIVELSGWNFGLLDQWTEPGVDIQGKKAILFEDDNETLPEPARYGIVDNDANIVAGDVMITTNNVAPLVVAPSSPLATILEGDTLTIGASNAFTFTDPGILDTHTASIAWGDNSNSPGSVSETLGTAPVLDPETLLITTPRVDTSGTVTGNHLYADDASYTITATVTDDVGSQTATTPITVQDVPPAVTLLDISSGFFTDPGADAPWTGIVTYGDGTTASLTIDEFKQFSIPFHSFACGSNTVTVTITDKDGVSGSASETHILGCSFASPVANRQFDASSGVPVKLVLTFDGLPLETATVTFKIHQDVDGVPNELDVISNDGGNTAVYDSGTDTYILHARLKGYNPEMELRTPTYFVAIITDDSVSARFNSDNFKIK